MWPVSDRATPPPGCFGRSPTEPHRRQAVLAGLRPSHTAARLFWPVSDRATLPPEGSHRLGDLRSAFRPCRETPPNLKIRCRGRSPTEPHCRQKVRLLWPVSDRATLPPEVSHRIGRPSVGRSAGSGDPAELEDPLLWPVSDRATPPPGGVPPNSETFGRAFRRGRETPPNLTSGDPAELETPPNLNLYIRYNRTWKGSHG